MLKPFLSLLNGEQNGRIVWTADITYWIAGQRQRGTAKPEWETEEGFLQLHRELGIMPYYEYDRYSLAYRAASSIEAGRLLGELA